ncbi:hypothetical protein [Streptomyces sp. NRRL B-1347]|uniref:hypothetical protein n=1 Tax=Streptomyces sp. NRRL B-1347 TaxID=1476877 RepID=UPI0004C80C61|nr:hypothetical protein [Streptomyces sp. NRRL B-1347]
MELTTARECADRWGVSYAYARRILSSLDSPGRDQETGAKQYKRAEADAARAAQPSRGYRSDMRTAPMAPARYRQLLDDETVPVEHRALWAMLWEGQARVGEALALDARDVDPEEHAAVDERRIPLSDQSAALVRTALDGRSSGPLFSRDGQRPLSRQTAARWAALHGESLHALCNGGWSARRSPRPPQVSYDEPLPETDEERSCQCLCASVHPREPEGCQGAADEALLVDATVVNSPSGRPERKLRPFCPPCYEHALSSG